MLCVRNIRVESFGFDYVHVLWQLEPTAETVSDYDFYVLRSGGQAGPYHVVAGPLVDTYIWRDNTAHTGRRWSDYYYRVRVVNRSDPTATQEFGSASPEDVAAGHSPGGIAKEPEPPLVAREIIYRFRKAELTPYSGRDVFVFQARTFGEYCRSCTDPVKNTRKHSHCPVCFDTGFAGGYWTPIQVRMKRVQLPDELSVLMDRGRNAPVQQAFQLANFPEIKPRDVVVDSRGQRWRVNHVKPSYYQDCLVSQTLVCARVIRSDIEYELPLKGVDLLRLQPADERHYTGATNLTALTRRRNRYQPPEV